MIKVLSCRFQRCLGPLTMLLVVVVGISKMKLFRHLSSHALPSPYFRQYMSYEVNIFFLKRSKINLNLKNWENNLEKGFCFLYNSISIGSVKFSLLRRKILVICSQCVDKQCYDFSYH